MCEGCRGTGADAVGRLLEQASPAQIRRLLEDIRRVGEGRAPLGGTG